MVLIVEYHEKDFNNLIFKENVYNSFITNCKNNKVSEIIVHMNGSKPFIMKHHKVTIKNTPFNKKDYKNLQYKKIKPIEIYTYKEEKRSNNYKKSNKKEKPKVHDNKVRNKKIIRRHGSKTTRL